MKQYVLEWSKKSNCFHIQPLSDMLASNQRLFIENIGGDYIVIMAGSKEACHTMADSHRDRLLFRSKGRPIGPVI